MLLKTTDGNRYLPIWIGQDVAAAILMKLQGQATPRPLTHDLFTNALGELDAEVVRVCVTELRESTFIATITIRQNGSELEIDSRPSDAIALAVRADAPIFADDRVIEESAIEFEGEDINEDDLVDEFKKFLDKVTPDEFAAAEGEPPHPLEGGAPPGGLEAAESRGEWRGGGRDDIRQAAFR